MKERAFVLAALASCLLACGGGGDEDAGPTPDGAAAACASDSDCGDEVFCNGAESCDPDNADADARGCVVGEDPCSVTEMCDESGASCEPVDCTNADADGDGVDSLACGGADCDDADSDRFPGNLEVCDPDDHDEDCNPATFGTLDADGDGEVSDVCCNVGDDGSTLCGEDCDDTAAGVNPEVPEVCDEIDNDCDTTVDEDVISVLYRDMDGDGFGDPAVSTPGCAPGDGWVASSGDCDDSRTEVIPAFRECTSTTEQRTCQPTGEWMDQTCGGGTPYCDARTAMCNANACGDSVTHDNEQCDDGNASEIDGCDNNCRIIPGETRPLTPYSNRATASQRPEFRFTAAPDATDYDIQLSTLRSFASVALQFSASDVTFTPSSDIPRGRYWWRVRGKTSAAMGAVPGPWSVAFSVRVGYAQQAFVERTSGSPNFSDQFVWSIPGNSPRVHVFGFGDLAHGSAAGITSGDFNGDGRADLLIADPDWDDNFYGVIPDTGRVAVYLGALDTQFSTPSFRRFLDGSGANARFGEMTGAVGDVDGDGMDDLVTGRPTGNPSVYFGYPPTDEVELDVPSYDAAFSRVAGGDLDGDGLSDIVVTTYRMGSTGLSAGSISVFLGRETWGAGPVTPSLTFAGPAGSFAGCSVVLEDLDRDGYADLVVGGQGAGDAGPATSGSGRVMVWRGGATFDTGLDLTYGPGSSSFGWSVDAGVDMNSDGFLDLVVGAPTTSSRRGTSQEFYGGSPLAADAGAVVTGPQVGAQHGRGVGLFDGSSGSVVIAGAPFFDPTGASNAGQITVWRGSTNLGTNNGAAANDNQGMTIGR